MSQLKWLSINCSEATRLLSRQQEAPLSWFTKLKLNLHLKICGPCKRFAAQIALLTQSLRKLSSTGTGFTEEKKSEMEKILKEPE